MKRFLVFLVVLALLGAGGYYWWQKNSTRIITAQVQQLARRFFVNPENITVKNSPVKMVGLRVARLDELVISGKDLQLRDGATLAFAKLVLHRVEVSGPPFRLSNIGNGTYQVKATDSAVTEYLHKRGGNIAGFNVIPLNTLTVKFIAGSTATAQVQGEAEVPLIKQHVPLTATGNLVPSSTTPGQLDYRVNDLKVEGFSLGTKSVKKALAVIDPVIDLSSWPIETDFTSIKTQQGVVVITGTITGVDQSLLP